MSYAQHEALVARVKKKNIYTHYRNEEEVVYYFHRKPPLTEEVIWVSIGLDVQNLANALSENGDHRPCTSGRGVARAHPIGDLAHYLCSPRLGRTGGGPGGAVGAPGKTFVN